MPKRFRGRSHIPWMSPHWGGPVTIAETIYGNSNRPVIAEARAQVSRPPRTVASASKKRNKTKRNGTRGVNPINERHAQPTPGTCPRAGIRGICKPATACSGRVTMRSSRPPDRRQREHFPFFLDENSIFVHFVKGYRGVPIVSRTHACVLTRIMCTARK